MLNSPTHPHQNIKPINVQFTPKNIYKKKHKWQHISLENRSNQHFKNAPHYTCLLIKESKYQLHIQHCADYSLTFTLFFLHSSQHIQWFSYRHIPIRIILWDMEVKAEDSLLVYSLADEDDSKPHCQRGKRKWIHLPSNFLTIIHSFYYVKRREILYSCVMKRVNQFLRIWTGYQYVTFRLVIKRLSFKVFITALGIFTT